MQRRFILLLLSVLVLLTMSLPTLAAGAESNAETYGIWTLVPPIVAIALAFITKNVILSLFVGVLSGTYLLQLSNTNFVSSLILGFMDVISYALSSLADSWNAGIILQVLTIGGLIALISKMGGAKAVAEALAKRAKGPRSAQIVTWLMGILVFFDDYANSLIVGPIMRSVTDKLRISREKLAFIVDATAAPIAGIALISTWVGYEIGLINDGYLSIGQQVNSYGIFVQTIPYRFYNILMLAFVFFTSYFLRDFGPMYAAERRARVQGQVLSPGAKPMVSQEATGLEPAEGTVLNPWNAIIPILTLIVAAFAGFYYNGYTAIMGSGDQNLISLLKTSPFSFPAIREAFGASDASVVLFQAAVVASIVAIAMGIKQKIFDLGEAIDTWVHGMKSLVITGVILLLAWSLSGVIKELGTAKYLVNMLSDSVPAFLLPSLIFILGSMISFATGTSYGTMGILMPLAIPFAAALSPDPNFIVMNVGAVLTGAIFGDHCSPISDTTILSSMGAASDHIDHVKTQLPYAIGVGLFTIFFGYLPVGLGLSIWVVLPVSIVILGLGVRFFGRPVEVETAPAGAEVSLKSV
ncbi:MAG: Na+/H+ antiporter NhaC family protein [Firmicutes bacterium]|nr:Na+/H+ antiporter NhaC family protein [Bacillota bacterium]